MEEFVKRMIDEHRELVARIQKLDAWVYGEAYQKVDAVEFANECVQLRAMKVYENALRARLFNQGIIINGTDYLVSVDDIEDEPEEQENIANNN